MAGFGTRGKNGVPLDNRAAVIGGEEDGAFLWCPN
jgi:hypothetical protein